MPAYTAKTAQQMLVEFRTPEDWLPNSLDLNLLDFSIFSVLKAKVQATDHNNLVALRLSIAAEWDWLAEE